MPRRRDTRNLWDKIWKDPRGKIVLYQTPNLPLLAWAVLTTLSLFVSGTLSNILWYAAVICLIAWSGLEIIQGVNYFRRVLGLAILCMAIAAVFHAGL